MQSGSTASSSLPSNVSKHTEHLTSVPSETAWHLRGGPTRSLHTGQGFVTVVVAVAVFRRRRWRSEVSSDAAAASSSSLCCCDGRSNDGDDGDDDAVAKM